MKRQKGKTVFKGKRSLHTLPAVGKTFRKRTLPPISGKIFSRLSQIYGIPIKELTPVVTRDRYVPTYFFPSHRISMKHNLYSSKTVDHELLHSLQYLLEKVPRAEHRRDIANTVPYKKVSFLTEIWEGLSSLYRAETKPSRTFREPSANVTHPQITQPFFQAMSDAKFLPIYISSVVFFGRKAAIPIAFLVTAPNIYRGMITRHYYKKHGADGLILLFADPPKNIDLLDLKSKENEFVERGYLKERGGLTPKGIQYLRQIMPRGLVLERLQDFKKYRRKK